MALGATIYNFDISLSDVDRGVYEQFVLRVAQHPTENEDYMLTRVLAYCLEFCEGIELAKALDDPSQPAVWARNYAGELLLWVEVGMPDAEKIHRASKAANRVAIYTHRDPAMLRRNLAGKTIYRADEIPLFAFDRAFLAPLLGNMDRRASLSVSVNEHHLYTEMGGVMSETYLTDHKIV